MDFTIWKYENGYQTDVIPIVYLHSFRGNGEDVWNACHGLKDCPPMVLVSVNNPGTGLDDELSPWPAEGVWGRRAVALAGGGGVEGAVALQGAGGGTSALDDGGVRPAGGGGVRYKGYSAGNRRLLPRRPLRPLGHLELRVFPEGRKRLRLPLVSGIHGLYQEQ